jgi:hypothetical protein
MRTVIDIQFGVTGQSLYLDCPEGRPSAVASVQVWRNTQGDDAEVELALSGSPAVEAAPNTTTSAAAGFGQADRRAVPLTATTSVAVGRTYLITTAGGSSEWVEVAEVTFTVATARHPLQHAYASGAAFASTRITAAIDATWAADESNLSPAGEPNGFYRARWQYTVGGVVHVRDTYFDLVRYPGRHSVLGTDVEALVPGWIDRLPLDYRRDQGRRLIEEAYRAVKLDLHAVDRADQDIAAAEVMDELVRYKALELGEFARLLSGGSNQDSARYDLARGAYGERKDSLVRVVSRVPQREVGGAATPRPATPITMR